MSYSVINNVKVKGIAAAVPSRIEKNFDSKLIPEALLAKYIDTTGVRERHCAFHDGSICTSDLCYESAEKLLNELGWNREEIGLLIFVSHTQDYKLPATACILQERLGLSKETMAFDITLGCSGYAYGLTVATNIVSHGFIKKALLLVGNTQSVYASPLDKSTSLLFGDSGSATALEFSEYAEPMYFHNFTDGGGFKSLIVPDGGCRNPFNADSLKYENFDDGISRTRLHEVMDGMEVFTFAVKEVPRSMKNLLEESGKSIDDIDYLLLHQANKFICEKIRAKLKIDADRTPYNIDRYGNTSAGSLPLLMVTELKDRLSHDRLNLLGCGFGVGLSIGSFIISTDPIVVPDLISVD